LRDPSGQYTGIVETGAAESARNPRIDAAGAYQLASAAANITTEKT
jgi:hypothetical protein